MTIMHSGAATRTLVLASLGLAMGLLATTAAEAAPRAPLGFQLMCLKTPAECRGGGKSSVAPSTHVLATLKTVNLQVNRTIRPRNDRGPDVWNANATSGDCEDYVLAKRRALIKAGLPPSALRIAHVKTRSGEGHAVLVVNTGGSDLVLDNLTHTIRSLSQTGYQLVSMSGADPRKWS
jgi:predicted transglutaminase-like cysteine proteinase